MPYRICGRGAAKWTLWDGEELIEGLDEDGILEWILGEWRQTGPTVCILEGFSGIGKTSVAQRARRAWSDRAVLVSAQESDDLETLLLLIAARLEQDGCAVVADQAEGDFRQGVLDLIREDSLIVLDDFEQLLLPKSCFPSQDVMQFIS